MRLPNADRANRNTTGSDHTTVQKFWARFFAELHECRRFGAPGRRLDRNRRLERRAIGPLHEQTSSMDKAKLKYGAVTRCNLGYSIGRMSNHDAMQVICVGMINSNCHNVADA